MRKPVPLFAAAMLLLLPGAARALTVTVAYDPGHISSTGAFTAQEQAVFTEAASQWSAAIGGSQNVTVTFVKASSTTTQGHLGFAQDLVGDAGVDASGRAAGNPVSATLFINDSITFFVDTTPGGNTEYSASAAPGAPSTYLDTGPANHDLLTLALHEIGHGVGFDSDYQDFWANATTVAGRPAYEFQSSAASGDPAYQVGVSLTNGGVFLISTMVEDEDFVNNGKPTHLDDVGGAGAGAGYFPFDLMNPGFNQGERRLIANVDVDVLCDAYTAYSCASVPEPGASPLLAVALLGLAFGLRLSRPH